MRGPGTPVRAGAGNELVDPVGDEAVPIDGRVAAGGRSLSTTDPDGLADARGQRARRYIRDSVARGSGFTKIREQLAPIPRAELAAEMRGAGRRLGDVLSFSVAAGRSRATSRRPSAKTPRTDLGVVKRRPRRFSRRSVGYYCRTPREPQPRSPRSSRRRSRSGSPRRNARRRRQRL
jgi:hypothetical protein